MKPGDVVVVEWGSVLTEKREIESPEILVLGASFDGSKKVRVGGIGSCDPRGNIQWECRVPDVMLSASYIPFYQTLQQVKKLWFQESS